MASATTALSKLTVLLERITETLATTDQRIARDVVGAARTATLAYIRMTIAIGLARLSVHERSRELYSMARKQIQASSGNDSVHSCICAIFDARLHQLESGFHLDVALPASIQSQLDTLDRVNRFKVDRLRQYSLFLSLDIIIDATERFGRFGRSDYKESIRNPQLTVLGATPEKERINRISELAELIHIHPLTDDAAQTLFYALADLPEREAIPILARVVGSAGARPSAGARLNVYALALFVCARFAYGEFAQRLALDIIGQSWSGDDLTKWASLIIRSLRRLGLDSDLCTFVAQHAHVLSDRRVQMSTRLTISGAMEYVHGVTDSVLQCFEEAHESIPTRLKVSGMSAVRDVAVGCSHSSVAFAESQIIRLLKRYEDVSEKLATNSHYSLSSIMLTEAVVNAITNLAISSVDVSDEKSRELVARRYL